MTGRPTALRSLPTAFLALAAPLAALGQAPGAGTPPSPPARPVPCTSPVHRQFDFWVGEWIVKDTATGAVIAFDRVEKTNDGCTLLGVVFELDDQYRDPASPHRLRGLSMSGYDGRVWRHAYTDNMGTFLIGAGGLDENGAMVLSAPLGPSGQSEVKAIWQPLADGTVHSIGYRRQNGGEWQPFYDIMYHPNRPAGAVAGGGSRR